MRKLLVAALVLLPTLSMAHGRSRCERLVDRSREANYRADVANAEYTEAQEVYARELKQNSQALTAEEARLTEAMKLEIDAEYAAMDAELRARASEMRDVNGNLSPVYLELREKYEANVNAIVERYTAEMNRAGVMANEQSFAKVCKAYSQAKAAVIEAQNAYDAARLACD